MALYTGDEWERILKHINEAVDGIPGDDGWWNPETREPFIECAVEMVQRGIGLTEVSHLLTAIYVAVCREYGD